MRKPHIYAEFIKAWAEGKEIECRQMSMGGYLTEWAPISNPNAPAWDATEYRIKPEPPARVYPVTGLSTEELYEIWRRPAVPIGSLTNVANAALRHAIDSWQVYTPQDVYDMKTGWLRAPSAARDLAVAESAERFYKSQWPDCTPFPCAHLEGDIIATVKD